MKAHRIKPVYLTRRPTLATKYATTAELTLTTAFIAFPASLAFAILAIFLAFLLAFLLTVFTTTVFIIIFVFTVTSFCFHFVKTFSTIPAAPKRLSKNEPQKY